MKGSYLGPNFSNDEIEKTLIKLNAKYEKVSDSDLISKVAFNLSKEKIVGWFQGKMEFGPMVVSGSKINFS